MTLTQILQKIRSAFYTKAETDALLGGKIGKPDGLNGQILTQNNNKITSENPIQLLNLVNTQEDLNNALSSVPLTLQDVFNNWYRFAHSRNYVQNDMSKPQIQAALNAWYFDSSKNAIGNTVNTDPYVGFVSEKTYKNWRIKTKGVGTDVDDDFMSIIVAFMTDSSGVEHTLSVVRGGGKDNGWIDEYAFALILDYGNGTNTILAGIPRSELTGSLWSAGAHIEVTRNGDTIVAKTSQFGSDVLDKTFTYTAPTSQGSLSLVDYTNIRLMLNNKSKIGFGMCSQPGYFILEETEGIFDNTDIYDVLNNKIYTYNNGWVQNGTVSSKVLNLSRIYNEKTDKLFYYKDEEVYQLNTSSSEIDLSDYATKSELLNKANNSDLSAVATSGSYNDLTNKPTIPTVNNATLTIQKNGTTVKTFTANSSANVTANIVVPTKTSELTNDSGYITSSNVVDRTSNQSINGEKTFNNEIQTNGGLYTKADIRLRIQNIDNIETNPTNQIGSSGIGFTNKDASAWLAYNRYFRTTVDGTAYLQLYCLPIKKTDGSSTIGGYINIYNTGVARVNDPLSIDPNATWNNNNIVTSNWVRKYFSNSIGDYWGKSATGNQYSRSTFSYLSTIDKATTNTSWSTYRPFRMVDKDNSIELGYVEYGYKSDLAYIRLLSNHNKGGASDLTIHSNGVSYFDNCKELWLVNKNLDSYNTTPSNEIDTQIWFTDKNANKYATLQTDYYADGARQFALTHKSLRTDTWIGLNIRTSPTDDVIISQPRFQAQNGLIVLNTDSNKFTDIRQGSIEMSSPDFCYIDFKHAANQDYLGRIGINPNNILFLETINGAPIMANGKNIVRSINGQVADTNGNIAYDIGNDLRTVNVDTAIGSIRLFVYRGSTPLVAMDVTSGGNLSLLSIAMSAYNESVVEHYMYARVSQSTMSGSWRNIGPAVTYGCSSLFIKVA